MHQVCPDGRQPLRITEIPPTEPPLDLLLLPDPSVERVRGISDRASG